MTSTDTTPLRKVSADYFKMLAITWTAYTEWEYKLKWEISDQWERGEFHLSVFEKYIDGCT